MTEAGCRVNFLGTGTAIPSADRGPTGVWIETPSHNILVDLGSGTLQKLLAAGGQLATLDAVLLTHTHVDHVADLMPLLFALRVPGSHREREKPLELILSRTAHAHIDAITSAWGRHMQPDEDVFRYKPLTPGERAMIGDITVRTAMPKHDPTSIGFRISLPGIGRIAIPGDTAPCDALLALCSDVDLLIIECSTDDEHALPGHLHPSSLLDLLHAARPGHTAVVHRYAPALSPEVEKEISSQAPNPVFFPNDGDQFVIPKS